MLIITARITFGAVSIVKVGALVKSMEKTCKIGMIIAISEECRLKGQLFEKGGSPVVSWSDGTCELIHRLEKIQLLQDNVDVLTESSSNKFRLRYEDEDFSENKERFIAP